MEPAIRRIQRASRPTTSGNAVLTSRGLTDIVENYAQIVEEKNERQKKETQTNFPRYHQLDVVRRLLADAAQRGVGRRYLIQHSAGSGKSNSIAWQAHQLIGLCKGGKTIFDSIIVVTDRRILDKQLRDTIKQFAQVGAIVGAMTEGSGELRRVHRGWEEDNHLHRAEVSLHSRRDRRRAPQP